MAKLVKVAVANGSQLWCDKEVLDCPWYTQDQEFATNFRIFPLGTYDVILGMDWLEYHSHMLIDWPKRCMQVEHEGFTIILQGITSSTTSCECLNIIQLASMDKQSAVAYVVQLCYVEDSENLTDIQYTELPPEIAQVLLDYEDVFQEPTELPPKQDCDHTIPLMHEAQPVNI